MTKLSVSFALLLACMSSVSSGQTTQPSIKQQAEGSTCANIVALAGNVNIDCSSLTPEQQKIFRQIPILLSRILAKQADVTALKAEMNKILKVVQTDAGSTVSRKQRCETGSLCNQDSQVNAPQTVSNNFERPYRHLTDAQRSVLQALADTLPSDSSFLHIEIVNDPEALKYGNEIANYFRSKTRTIGVGLSYPRGMPEGVYVQSDGPLDPSFPMAKKIASAFASCQILKGFIAFQNPHPNQVYILIGVRPEH